MKAGIVSAGNHCIRLLLALLPLLPAALSAAEVRGAVTLQHSGLFAGRGDADPVIGLALWPAEPDLTTRTPAPRVHELRIDAGHIRPDYLLIRPGEPVRLINLDPVEHQIFALVPGARSEIDVRLQPGSDADTHSLRFDAPGTRHLFCRLHRRSYARIDVVDAPRLRRVSPGERFEFRDLEAGRWRLRVSAIGAETQERETVALTAPPPLELRLPVRSGMQPEHSTGVEVVTVDQLYPAAPVR
jgi:plastocyanin